MTRRTISIAVLAVALVAVAVVAATSAGGDTDEPPVARGASTRSSSTATVMRRDLVEREEVDGTLGYGDTTELAIARPGTVTGRPAKGSTVDRNGVAAEIDGSAVRLLFGSRPMWRDLAPDVGNGPDIRQLEENLVALGYATSANLTVDEDWTDATTAAVKRWQKANGVAETGTVSMGDIVFAPGPVRVVGHGERSLTVTGTTKVVSVDLDVDRRALLPVGAQVEVELPDGSTAAGVVTAVDAVVTPPPADAQGGGEATVGVAIALLDPAAVPFDEAPVDVKITATKAAGVLTVPVDALLAVAGGTYAVERVSSGGAVAVVPVELGAFADGFVEVRRGLAEGDKVVVAR